jgi:GNAT superfamily N-acetyltransferase
MGAGISLTWRTLTSADSREVSPLLDQSFDLKPPHSYLRDFPVWDPAITPSPNRFQVGGFLGDKLVSTASLRVADYRFHNGSTSKFGLVGAVATHPEHLKKGFATEALSQVIQEGERRSVETFVLWGSESPLYVNQKFKFSGLQTRVPLRSLVIPKTILKGFELRMGWDEVIGEFILNRNVGLQYAPSDLLWLSRHPSVEWRTFWLDGKCLAYCAWNRGIDLPNMIHELDGDHGAVLTLLRFMQERYPELEWITHSDFISKLGIEGSESGVHENLAQFRGENIDSSFTNRIWFSGMDSC